MKAFGLPYTVNEIELAIALRNHGLAWSIIAMRLGRTPSALQGAVSRYRHGLWAPAKIRDRSAKIDRAIEGLVASGVTSIREIAEAIGISPPGVCQRLGRLGLDHEMRMELAASSGERIAA